MPFHLKVQINYSHICSEMEAKEQAKQNLMSQKNNMPEPAVGIEKNKHSYEITTYPNSCEKPGLVNMC